MQAQGIERSDPSSRSSALASDSGAPTAEPRPAETVRGDPSGGGFRTLMAPQKAARSPASGDAAAMAGAGGGLARPLAPPADLARGTGTRAVAPRPEIARLLIGQAHAAREARIELRGGLFAGTSIHLVSAPGGVDVRLEAPSEAARLALASVMDRVGLHLRSRGIVMRPGASLDTGSRQNQRDGRERR